MAADRIFLLLGSNLGDRMQIFDGALSMLEARTGKIISRSGRYETEPWGVRDQPAFLNMVVEMQTEQAPEEVLKNILNIEHDLGRVRYERWGARIIDIDLLFYGDLIIDTARLTLPHPRIQERRFTLVPLAEIAPDFVHPSLLKTSAQLLAECPDNSLVSELSRKNTI